MQNDEARTVERAAEQAHESAPFLDARSAEPNGSYGNLHELLQSLQAMRVGDFSVRMSGDSVGIFGKVADTFNEIVAANERMAQQLERVGAVVGREGKTRQRVRFALSSGAW